MGFSVRNDQEHVLTGTFTGIFNFDKKLTSAAPVPEPWGPVPEPYATHSEKKVSIAEKKDMMHLPNPAPVADDEIVSGQTSHESPEALSDDDEILSGQTGHESPEALGDSASCSRYNNYCSTRKRCNNICYRHGFTYYTYWARYHMCCCNCGSNKCW